jgi:signal transduction histidine kinase
MNLLRFAKRLRDRGYIPVILLVVSLLVTIGITFYFGLTVRELLQTQFDRRHAGVIRSLNTRVQSYSFLLKGIQSLMESDQNFSEEEFMSYIKRFVNPAIYPGIIEAGYFGPNKYSVTYKRNASPDILTFTAAQTKARISGTFSTDVYKNRIIVIFLPVYFPDSDGQTLENSQDTIRGYAFVTIDSRDLLSEIIGNQANIGVRLNTEPFFSTGNDVRELSFLTLKKDTTYQFFDVEWPLTLTQYPNKELSDHVFFLIVIALFGLCCSIIVYQVNLRQYRSQKKADSLEQQKDEFVAVASHELKTPLTSIKALNQLLAEKLTFDKNPLYDSYFRKTDSQIRRMEHLIKDLMDVSKIRANKLDYNKDWFDLENTVRTICEDMQEVRKSHQITVNGKLHQNVYGDKDRIAQVLTNLLTNAIKYSPQANLVIVTMKETLKDVIVSTQDFGIGIGSESQRRIFERFYRVSQDERKFQGMGIGLFISSEIIGKHGGRIWVKSTKGKGSTFFFSLPLKPREE